MAKIKIILFLSLFIQGLTLVSCDDEPNVDEKRVYIELDIKGVDYTNKGKHGYFVEFGKQGGSFSFSSDSLPYFKGSGEFDMLVADGKTVFRAEIGHPEGTPYGEYSWSWGTIRQTSARMEPYAYEIRIAPLDAPDRRVAEIHVGHYPCMNTVSIVQDGK